MGLKLKGGGGILLLGLGGLVAYALWNKGSSPTPATIRLLARGLWRSASEPPPTWGVLFSNDQQHVDTGDLALTQSAVVKLTSGSWQGQVRRNGAVLYKQMVKVVDGHGYGVFALSDNGIVDSSPTAIPVTGTRGMESSQGTTGSGYGPMPPGGISGGVGSPVTFPVGPRSFERVELVTAQMMRGAEYSQDVELLADSILRADGIMFKPTIEAARSLQSFVNNKLPIIPDPDRWESMTSPQEIASMVMRGQVPGRGLDCDDKSPLLAALFRVVGFRSTVAFYDLDGDGEVDHAMASVQVPGFGLLAAETVSPGKDLGWEPAYVTREYLPV